MPEKRRGLTKGLSSEEEHLVVAHRRLLQIIAGDEKYIHCDELRDKLNIGEKRFRQLKKAGHFKTSKPGSHKMMVCIDEAAAMIVRIRQGAHIHE